MPPVAYDAIQMGVANQVVGVSRAPPHGSLASGRRCWGGMAATPAGERRATEHVMSAAVLPWLSAPQHLNTE